MSMGERHLATRFALRNLRLKKRVSGDTEAAAAITRALRDADVVEAVAIYAVPRFATSQGFDAGELGDGQLLARFLEFGEWILEHADEILALILKLAPLFAQEKAVGIVAALLAFLLLAFGASAAGAQTIRACPGGVCPQYDVPTVEYYEFTAEPGPVLMSPIAEQPVIRPVRMVASTAAQVTRRATLPRLRQRWSEWRPVRRFLARLSCRHRL